MKNDLIAILNLLTSRDKFKLVIVTIAQVLISLLDLIGIFAIGLLGIISVNELQSTKVNPKIDELLEILGANDLSFNNRVILIGVFVIFLLVIKSLLSVILTRKIIFFLSRRSAIISSDLLSKFLRLSMSEIYSKTFPEVINSIKNGVGILMIGIVATGSLLISEFFSLVILLIGLFFYNSVIALLVTLLFGAVAGILYLLTHTRAQTLGANSTRLNVTIDNKIMELFSTYREVFVRNRRSYYLNNIRKMNISLADTSAEQSFMPYIGKYVIEMTLVIGVFIVISFQIIMTDFVNAVSTMAIFLAAGARLAPAILRVQQSLIVIRNGLGAIKPTLQMITQLRDINIQEELISNSKFEYSSFNSSIKVSKISFKYPGKFDSALNDISFSIPSGSSIAIIGPSGAGKTTLIDIILGLLIPNTGSITISDVSPAEAIKKWPGAIAYVPQEVVINSNTVRENICLGFDAKEFSDDEIFECLKIAHLDTVINKLPEGLNTVMGERGYKFSGGERQRLGIARAIFTKPKILILDESTSSLDIDNENLITNSLQNLYGKVTVITIAHRLSTVKNSDLIIYLDNGKFISSGKFEALRKSVPNFDKNVKLSGL